MTSGGLRRGYELEEKGEFVCGEVELSRKRSKLKSGVHAMDQLKAIVGRRFTTCAIILKPGTRTWIRLVDKG